VTDLDPTWLQAKIEQTIAEMTDQEFDGMVLRTRAPRLEPQTSVKELVERELKRQTGVTGLADVGPGLEQALNNPTNL
jgi:hypothetical protein